MTREAVTEAGNTDRIGDVFNALAERIEREAFKQGAAAALAEVRREVDAIPYHTTSDTTYLHAAVIRVLERLSAK